MGLSVKIVVKAVFYGGADSDLHVFTKQAFDCVGHKMGRSMAIYPKPFRASKGDNLQLTAILYNRGQIGQLTVDFTRDRLPCQPGPDSFSNILHGAPRGNLFNRTVWQFYAQHNYILLHE